jgi:hypothetical protein
VLVIFDYDVVMESIDFSLQEAKHEDDVDDNFHDDFHFQSLVYGHRRNPKWVAGHKNLRKDIVQNVYVVERALLENVYLIDMPVHDIVDLPRSDRDNKQNLDRIISLVNEVILYHLLDLELVAHVSAHVVNYPLALFFEILIHVLMVHHGNLLDLLYTETIYSWDVFYYFLLFLLNSVGILGLLILCDSVLL